MYTEFQSKFFWSHSFHSYNLVSRKESGYARLATTIFTGYQKTWSENHDLTLNWYCTELKREDQLNPLNSAPVYGLASLATRPFSSCSCHLAVIIQNELVYFQLKSLKCYLIPELVISRKLNNHCIKINTRPSNNMNNIKPVLFLL